MYAEKPETILLASENMVPSMTVVSENLRSNGIDIVFDERCIPKVKHFRDTEALAEIGLHVRGHRVILAWDFVYNDTRTILVRFQELLLVLDALKRAGVGGVILWAPYLWGSRQDRKLGRQTLTAKLVAQQLEATGVIDMLLTIELHVAQIGGFYDKIHIENLPAEAIFAPFFRKEFEEEIKAKRIVVVSTDVGGAARARDCANYTAPGTPIAIIDKRRDPTTNKPRIMNIVGEVESMSSIIYDDIGGSMISLLNAGKRVLEDGAIEWSGAIAHNVCCSTYDDHDVFISTAEQKILASGKKIYTLDTLPRGEEYFRNNSLIVKVPTEPFTTDIFEAVIKSASIKDVIKKHLAFS